MKVCSVLPSCRTAIVLPFKSRTARTCSRANSSKQPTWSPTGAERVAGIHPGEGRPDEVRAEVDLASGGRFVG